jgi:hypothetical protein
METMSDTPKFEVIDRRKRKLDEEAGETVPAQAPAPQPEAKPEGQAGPRLVVPEPEPSPEQAAPAAELEEEGYAPLPEAPTAEESRQQKSAYDASAERLEDLVRAQNPGAGPQPPVTFDNLVQQLYLSAMIQMGAGAREGERPRVDILGARQTIDLLGVLAEKTKGNLSAQEDKMVQTVLFETRMAFLELTNMITLQPPPPPPTAKKN